MQQVSSNSLEKNEDKLEKFRRDKDNTDSDLDEITEIEVEPALWKLNKDSGPGHDGLTFNRYKKFSSLFVPLITDLLNDRVNKKNTPSSLQMAIIKLLPRKQIDL